MKNRQQQKNMRDNQLYPLNWCNRVNTVKKPKKYENEQRTHIYNKRTNKLRKVTIYYTDRMRNRTRLTRKYSINKYYAFIQLKWNETTTTKMKASHLRHDIQTDKRKQTQTCKYFQFVLLHLLILCMLPHVFNKHIKQQPKNKKKKQNYNQYCTIKIALGSSFKSIIATIYIYSDQSTYLSF